MLSSLSKLYVAAAVLMAIAALIYGGAANYDRTGVFLLLGCAVAALVGAYASSGVMVTDIFRDPPADAPINEVPSAAAGANARNASWWPFTGGLAVVAAVLASAFGLAALLVAGLLGAVTLFGWIGQSFREDPRFTPRVGATAADRVSRPILLPVMVILGGAILVLAVSRIYLGLGAVMATVVSGVLGLVFFVGCALLASGRKVPGTAIAVVAVAASVAVVAAGLLSTALTPTHEVAVPKNYTELTVITKGTAFDKNRMEMPEGNIRMTFENLDPVGTFHNIGFYELPAGATPGKIPQVPSKPLEALAGVDGGKTAHFNFNTKQFGMEKGKSYQYRCDFHPAMIGEVDIIDGPPAVVKATHG